MAFNLTHYTHPSHIPILPSFEIQWIRSVMIYYMNKKDNDFGMLTYNLKQNMHLSSHSMNFVQAGVRFIDERKDLFDDFMLVMCSYLAKGDERSAKMLLAIDSLFLFAYFYDPTEKMFISPIEINFIDVKSLYNIEELFASIKYLSSIKINTNKKSLMKSAYLY
jgi:hypothetical protein